MTPETYTRDSDKKKFEDDELRTKHMGCLVIKPIPEPEPMPEILPGDYIETSTGNSFYYLDNGRFSNGKTYYPGSRIKHYRNGKLLWEAKK